MISILIACFNHNIEELVRDLLDQGRALECPFELIIHDNGNDSILQTRQKKLFNSIPELRYANQQSDNSRSASRNWMANQAKYPYLIFIDGDSAVVDNDFIRRYVEQLPTENVIVGGTAYRLTPPTKERKLRWAYGVEREQLNAEERTSQGNQGFSSFNFLMPKIVFEKVQFDETIKAYGHEDSLLGKELVATGIRIQQIDNPLYHEGLDENQLFLDKTAEAVSTLASLVAQAKLGREIRLFAAYSTLEKSGLKLISCGLLRILRPLITYQLNSSRPIMKLFDLWKLSHLCDAMRKKDPA